MSDSPTPPLDTDAIDRLVERLRKAADAPGAAVAVVYGNQEYVQGYGVKVKGEDAPVTPDTLFANASTTKAITTATMALLVDAGKMAWDDPVRRHLPAFRLSDPVADTAVTVRDLVCHRTGLPRHDPLWYHSPWDRGEVLRRIGYAKSSAPFRSLYQYQNICFAAAGEAVRVASGAESWEAFAHERLLTPLGMTRANFSERDAQRDPDHASPHQRIKEKIKPTPTLNFDAIGPAGTMNSSVREMLAWLRVNLSGGVLPDGTRLLSEAVVRELRTPQTIIAVDDATRARYPSCTQMSYGLGWSLWNYRDGHFIVSHSGAIDGFRAHVAFLPEKQIGVVVFVNLSAPFVEMVRNAVFDLLLGLPTYDWETDLKADIKKAADEAKTKEKERRDTRKNGKASPLSLSAYAGDYTDPAYGTATVTVAKGKKNLALSWGNLACPLRHQTFSAFLTEPEAGGGFEPTDATFTLTPDGKVASLTLYEANFVRTPPPPADKSKNG